MYIERRTAAIKPGCTDKAVRMIKSEVEKKGAPIRVYTAMYGPFDVVLIDTRGESQEAIEKLWADAYAEEDTPKYLEEWHKVVAGGGTYEMWEEVMGTPDMGMKYVERRTVVVKDTDMDEAIQLLKSAIKGSGLVEGKNDIWAYLFTVVYGPFETLIMDMRSNDAKAIEKFWADWNARPEAAALQQQWSPHVVSGKRELWVEQ